MIFKWCDTGSEGSTSDSVDQRSFPHHMLLIYGMNNFRAWFSGREINGRFWSVHVAYPNMNFFSSTK